MVIPINYNTAVKLAFILHEMDQDAILDALDKAGNAIVDGRKHLGMSEHAAHQFACRFCQATFDEIIKLRQIPDVPSVH